MQNTYIAILFLLIPTCFLSIHEASGCNRRALAQDSIVVAESNDPIIVKADRPTASVELRSRGQQLNTNKRFSLLMKGIDLKQSPEGVYEIYITHPNIDPSALISESAYFVDVLDTYMVGSTKGKGQLMIDITPQLLHLNRNASQVLNYLVTIVFKGNLKPDKTSAQNAGMLTIDSLQLIQMNKT